MSRRKTKNNKRRKRFVPKIIEGTYAENFSAYIKMKVYGHKIPHNGESISKEEIDEHINILSKQNGFHYDEYLGIYCGEHIYHPTFFESTIYGWPVFLHVRGDMLRKSISHDEALKILRLFYAD